MKDIDPRGAPTPVISRRYEGLADLPPLLAFASACTAARSPLASSWHPGDIVWELQARADRPQPAQFWIGARGVEALAWLFDDGEAWIEALPTAEHLTPEAVAWVEAAWRARGENAASATLKIRAYASDARRIAALEALGYRRAEQAGVNFRMSLEGPLPQAQAPPRVTVCDSVGVDPALRAGAHRAAWDHLEHLGIDAQSRFSTEAYLSLAALPVYDPSLDMLAVAPDGAFIASCIAWADGESGVGVFEPVGVAAPWRGQRLARLVMLEALRRLQARGLREARVGTAAFNHPAIAAYLACGFEQVDESWWWAKGVG
jgi:ribosomal protein S18 acetylase RimI-like enzyme